MSHRSLAERGIHVGPTTAALLDEIYPRVRSDA
jgi:hypothetical protein